MFLNKSLKNKIFVDSDTTLLDHGQMRWATFTIGILLARAISVEDYSTFVPGWSLIAAIQGIQRDDIIWGLQRLSKAWH